MNEDKKQDNLPDEEDNPRIRLEYPSHYLDEILADVTKLSGIIDLLATLNTDNACRQEVDFHDLAWAMGDFADSIENLAGGLWDHLKDIDALQSERPGKPATIMRAEK